MTAKAGADTGGKSIVEQVADIHAEKSRKVNPAGGGFKTQPVAWYRSSNHPLFEWVTGWG